MHSPTEATIAASTPPGLPRWLMPWLPYLAVLIGLYGLRNAWVACLGYHLGLVCLLTLGRQCPPARRLLAGFSWQHAALSVLGGAAAGAALYYCWPVFGFPPAFGQQMAHLGITNAWWPAFLTYFVCVNPLLEECAWRASLGSPSRAPIWHDVAFAGYHSVVMALFLGWPWLLVALAALTAVGWTLRQLARDTGGLLIPIIAHAAADAGIMLAVFAICRQGR